MRTEAPVDAAAECQMRRLRGQIHVVRARTIAIRGEQHQHHVRIRRDRHTFDLDVRGGHSRHPGHRAIET